MIKALELANVNQGLTQFIFALLQILYEPYFFPTRSFHLNGVLKMRCKNKFMIIKVYRLFCPQSQSQMSLLLINRILVIQKRRMGEERENMTGKKLKKFSFLKKLGSGSFGTVYEAIQEKTKKVVAVKVISKMQMKQIPKLNELVYSQIKILKEVKSENVIKFVDSFSTDQSIFIATEYCNGGDLEMFLKKKKKLSETESLTYIKQILNGFKGLHEANTMHRDFKLANVLLHNNVCKIADLGFAKQLKDRSLTGTVLGTDETMAPQVHEGKSYGWGADIWSIGVVYYQMLYGKVPYSGANEYMLLKNIKNNKVDFSSVDISEDVQDFISRCLTVDPKDRISWKQIYNHVLFNKESLALTKGLLSSKIAFDSHKDYYNKNQEKNKRKTFFEGYLAENTIPDEKKEEKDEQIFGNAGEVKDADVSKMQKILQKNEMLESEFQRYQEEIINERNNCMFGISQTLPMEKQLSYIDIKHGKAIFQICKLAYIKIKAFRKEVEDRHTSYGQSRNYKFWDEFVQMPISKSLCKQLFEDEIFAEAMTIGYLSDCSQQYAKNQNINRNTNYADYTKVLTEYYKELAGHIKKLSKRTKQKFIKILLAIEYLIEKNQGETNEQIFNKNHTNIDYKEEEKRIKGMY